MNYFEFFGIPVSFEIDSVFLKKLYFEKSRLYHPDFYAGKPEDVQTEALANSTLTTKAFQTLSQYDKRMAYIIELYGFETDKDNKLPQNFLMQMMDINEAIMEMEFDADPAKAEALLKETTAIETSLTEQVKPKMQAFAEMSEEQKSAVMPEIKDFYLKRKYLLRIYDRLNKFAAQ